MSKTLLPLMLYLCIALPLHAQTLDYTNYSMTYYDEFNYAPANFKTDPAFVHGATSPAGPQYGAWHIGDSTQCALGAELWDPAQVTMPAKGTIRCTANRTVRHIDYRHGGRCPGIDSAYYRSFLSGWLNTYQQFGPFGIMEAKIRIPSGHPFASFYMDNDHISILPQENWGDQWRAHLTSDYNIHNYDYGLTFAAGADTYHLFSVKWTPADLAFYYDDSLLITIPYATGRTNYSQLPIKLELATSPEGYGALWTQDGIFMDVAFVKVWTMNCTNEIFNLQDHGVRQVAPGQYKYLAIKSGNPSTLIQTATGNATVFEAESITLLPNFLADESVPATTSQVLEYGGKISRVSNGYVEIVPGKCSKYELEPIEGPDAICDRFNSWSNSTPGGAWSTDDQEIVIDPISGNISASLSVTPSRSFRIFYTVGGCTVYKLVTINNCR